MIKNVVFDFGNVLIRYNEFEMTLKYVRDENDARLVSAVVFDRLYWDRLDAGAISDDEVIRLSCERLPQRLHESAKEVYYGCIYSVPEIPGMCDIVERAKQAGKRTFILSNISEYFADNADKIPMFSRVEKCIFSAKVGHVKPNADMYEYLCRECGIKPDETLFIDDNEKNVEGARSFGIVAYHFDGNVKKLSEYLDSVL